MVKTKIKWFVKSSLIYQGIYFLDNVRRRFYSSSFIYDIVHPLTETALSYEYLYIWLCNGINIRVETFGILYTSLFLLWKWFLTFSSSIKSNLSQIYKPWWVTYYEARLKPTPPCDVSEMSSFASRIEGIT